MNKGPIVCMFNPWGQTYYENIQQEVVGGAELQLYLLSKHLTASGFETHVIYFDVAGFNKKKGCPNVVDGVHVHRIPFGNVKGKKFNIESVATTLHLWDEMRKIDADIYLTKTAPTFGPVGMFCLLKRKKYILIGAHDGDFNGWVLRNEIPNILIPFFEHAIKRAPCVVVQNEFQMKSLHGILNREGIQINSIAMPVEAPVKKDEPNTRKKVLWAGRMVPLKRPELVLELAAAMPEVDFIIVGSDGINGQGLEANLRKKAAAYSNVKMVGFVKPREVIEYFKSATVFINTSDSEGFPNTFLQAWQCETPVVSLNVDPDNVIVDYGLGFRSETIEQMVSDVRKLCKDDRARREIGKRAREYVQKEHSLNTIGNRYADIIRSLTEGYA